jgi:peptidoglycan/LPS O-acetylase OafA/YrhL
MLAAPIIRLVIVLSGVDSSATFLLTPCRIDALVAGGLIAAMNRETRIRDKLLDPARYVLLLSFISLCFLYSRRGNLDRFNDNLFETIGYTLLATLFASAIALTLALKPEAKIRNLLESELLVFLGKFSYGIYVFHWPIIIFLADGVRLPIRIDSIIQSRSLSMMMFWLSALILSLIAAVASYWLIERRFLAVKRHFQ